MTLPENGERVVIFGATSAVAAEVAMLFAARGARLHLVGRNAEKLGRVAERCSGSGSGNVVSTSSADFGELSQSESAVQGAITALGGIDVALIAHGDLGDQLESERASNRPSSRCA